MTTADSRNPVIRSEAPLSDPPDRKDATPATKRKRTKAAPLTSYADLFHAAYGPARRRWKPTRAEIDAIQAGPHFDLTDNEQLLKLALSDPSLKRTRDLMLYGMKRLDGPNSDGPVRRFVHTVLSRHPAYQSRSLKAALDRADDPLRQGTVHVLVHETRRWCERSTVPKRTANACIANALHCLLLWYNENSLVPLRLEDALNHLRTELWKPFAKRQKSTPDKLRALIADRDPYATSIACLRLEEQNDELRRQINISRTAESRTRDHAQTLEAEHNTLQTKVEDTATWNARLHRELDTVRVDHANEKAHMRDALENLRSSVARRLRNELALLNDGLHALRRDPPKVSVMTDHAERAIDGLTRELERLQNLGIRE